MAMDVAPKAAGAVDVFDSVDIDQHAAISSLDHKRLVLGHLRERMPNQRSVPVEQILPVLF